MKKPFLNSFALGLLVTLSTGCASYAPLLREEPITWNEERRQLTLAYMQERYGLQRESPAITPRMVVLHWTAIPTLQQSLEAFRPARLPQTRPDIQSAGALNVSAHYLVDRDGTIYHLLPDTVMARHTIGLNHCAIGIENVGGTPDTPLTEAQLQANIWLVRQLGARYPLEYLIGHHEYTLFDGHPLWLEQDTGYRTEKTDPGPDFMKRVRRAVRPLGLKGPPNR